jgi:hypothetical protein
MSKTHYWGTLGDGPTSLQLHQMTGVLMWILDDNDMFTDITPAAAAYTGVPAHEVIGNVIDEAAEPYGPVNTVVELSHLAELRNVVRATGQPSTTPNWINMSGASQDWYKIITTTTKIRKDRLLVVAHDITQMDPKARWLSRIDLASQRLKLRGDKSISFGEFAVLYHLVRGRKKKDIGERLNIAKTTVNHREANLKKALEVKSMADLMALVATSGLIHLLSVELDTSKQSPDTVALYRRMSDFPPDPR